MVTVLQGKPPFELMRSVKNRIAFLYLEYGLVEREQNALVFRRNGKDYDIPVASLTALMLGTGTSITQPAAAEIARWGCNVVIVAGGGLGLHATYSSGHPNNAQKLISQARLVSSSAARKQAAKRMFALRWGVGEDTLPSTIREMQLQEGRRMRDVYRRESERTGVAFEKRIARVDYDGDDVINQTITAGNHLLYGLAASVITGLGLSPGLGVVHTGNMRAFVFDIADLYKETLTIPTAFDLVSKGQGPESVRRAFREQEMHHRLIPKMIDAIHFCLALDDVPDKDESELWRG